MSFFIDHPDEWIGVPDRWPFPAPAGAIPDAVSWAEALLAEIEADGPLTAEVRERLRVMLLMAAARSEQNGTRMFLACAGWDGPVYLAEASTALRTQVGEATVEQLAGCDDPQQRGARVCEPVRTASGVEGVRCLRYLPRDEHGTVYGRVDYVFEGEGELLQLTGVEADLVHFERLKTALTGLAESVRWGPA